MRQLLQKITEKISALPLDKVLHFFIGGVLMMILYSLTPVMTTFDIELYIKWSVIWTFFLFILCGVKEVLDVIRDGKKKSFDYIDILTGLAGGWGYLILQGLLLAFNIHVE